MSEPLVLLVDDDETILESAAEFLELSGYRVLTASDATQALTHLQNTQPDLIISDVMMPGIDGHEFHRTIRSRSELATVPFIFLSARADEENIQRGTLDGADAYVTKPFDPDELKKLIDIRIQRAHQIRESLEHELEETRHQILNIFSHELRTPLSIIHGYVNILADQRNEVDPETLDDVLSAMRESSNRLVELTEDLLFMATIETGASRFIIDNASMALDMGELVRSVAERHIEHANSKRVEITIKHLEEVTIYGHGPYIEDIFSRLIDNGIKFNKTGGQVIISIQRINGLAEIVIKDTGIGIPKDEQRMIFDRFSQVARETLEQQGIGLGLAIAQRLANLHYGTILIESELEVGSIFSVRLPTDFRGEAGQFPKEE
jgi:signal transduction histidine kinase